MRVLIGCESSGVVRRAFRKRGHDAWSCDIKPSEDRSEYHIQDDVLNHLNEGWDLGIFHPDCTYLCSSGLHWNKRIPGRDLLTCKALEFVKDLLDCKIFHVCVENPVGKIGSSIRPADQYIQPNEFGHDASKRTGLWLRNLPKLKPTKIIEPRIINGKKRWGNQTDSGQNKLGPSDDRAAKRARTYDGWGDAMAEQWGNIK